MLPSHLLFPIHHGSRIHLGVTGSIAAYKSLELLRMFQALELVCSVTLTQAAAKFVAPLSFEALGASQVSCGMWNGPESAFGHLEPAQQARCLVIAPATANIMAKMAHGIADDLLSTQAVAFSGPVLTAPAMNPRLWEAQATQANVALLRQRGVAVLEPESGAMACGESGAGRLAGLEGITAHVLRALTDQDMAGRKVLLTLGPTREYFDPVRYWSNPSTGLMGACLALAAWLRGAEVTAIHGPVALWLPVGIRRVAVETAREMFEAATDLWPGQDFGLMTAAVSDFSPVPHGQEKFKKRTLASDTLHLEFATNPDILRTLGENKRAHQKLLGFCAETGDLAGYAAMKLKEKHCDMMVANSVSGEAGAFGSASNQVFVLDRQGRSEQWPRLGKPEVAWRLLEWMTHLLR